MEALIPKNGHNAWDDLACDARCPAIIHPLIEKLVIVEELSDDKVCSGVNLLFEVSDIILTRLCLEMNFRVTSNSNAEKVSVLFSDELNQIDSVVKAILDGNPIGGPSRRISSQSKEVLNAKLLGLVEGLQDFISCHIGACDVHEDIKAGKVLDVRTELQGDVRSGTASIPSSFKTEFSLPSHINP